VLTADEIIGRPSNSVLVRKHIYSEEVWKSVRVLQS